MSVPAPVPGNAPAVHSFPPERNPFETVVADVTHRCNMACANCYVPNRAIPDMDTGRLEECLGALPRRVNLRLIGAEPTMRRDLPEIVSMVRRQGHRPVLLTNGLRLARASYVRTLREAGLRHVVVSLNGADNDDWYEAIDSMRCAAKKLRAVENVVAQGDGRVAVSEQACARCDAGALEQINGFLEAHAVRDAGEGFGCGPDPVELGALLAPPGWIRGGVFRGRFASGQLGGRKVA